MPLPGRGDFYRLWIGATLSLLGSSIGALAIPLVALWDETTWVPGSPWLNGIDPVVVGDPIAGATLVGAGIITDYPGRLRAVMTQLGMPLPASYRIS